MNHRRLTRLERQLAAAQNTLIIPRTEEGLRHLCLQCLPALTAEAFGSDDSRCTLDYLRGLSSQAMLALYRQAMDTLVERSVRNPDAILRWFQSLTVDERIGLLRRHPINWDWVDRRVREFAAQEAQR